MKQIKPVFALLPLAFVALAIPATASAESVTLEATETIKGKASAPARFTAPLGSDRHAEIVWNDRQVRVELEVEIEKTKAAGPRRARFKVKYNAGEQRLHVGSVVTLTKDKRQVIGRASNNGSEVELAIIMSGP